MKRLTSRIKSYYIYIIECENGSFYTGITTDIDRRFDEHSKKVKVGAKYTKAFNAKKVIALWLTTKSVAARSIASKFEYSIKKLKRCEKLRLVLIHNYYKEIFSDFIDIKKIKRIK